MILADINWFVMLINGDTPKRNNPLYKFFFFFFSEMQQQTGSQLLQLVGLLGPNHLNKNNYLSSVSQKWIDKWLS